MELRMLTWCNTFHGDIRISWKGHKGWWQKGLGFCFALLFSFVFPGYKVDPKRGFKGLTVEVGFPRLKGRSAPCEQRLWFVCIEDSGESTHPREARVLCCCGPVGREQQERCIKGNLRQGNLGNGGPRPMSQGHSRRDGFTLGLLGCWGAGNACLVMMAGRQSRQRQ